MASVKKGTTLSFSNREECVACLNETGTNVYTPRGDEIWKTVKSYDYHCVIRDKKCVRGYIEGIDQYGHKLQPYIFWDKEQQAKAQHFKQERFLSKVEGERLYQLTCKMKKYYHTLKKTGRLK